MGRIKRGGTVSGLGMTLTIILLATALSACQVLEVSNQSQYQQGGVSLDKTRLDRITTGKTSRADVLASLGPPDTETWKDGQTTYTYHFDQQQNKRVRLLFLFSYRGQQTHQRSFYVRFAADDTVDKTWYNDLHPQALVAED